MKINKIYSSGAIIGMMVLAVACQTGGVLEMPMDEQIPISLFGDINQLAVTRASDNGFASGDQVGVWAVNYEGDTPGTLTLKDNQATNVRFTFNGSTWASDYDIYYKDKNTKVDIYGIYPYSSAISSIEAWPFEVQEDQSTVSSHGMMGGYEASDFLWAKREAVMPSPNTVQLLFQHKMSSVVVTLEEGTGFTAGEFASLSQSVLINNVKRNATINLATGVVTAAGAVPARSTVPAAYEGGFRAIVVPQTVSSASSLFSITLGGVSYTYSEGSAFTYVPGKQHNFAVTVDKKADGGFNVTVQTTISAWTNDNSSHEFVAKEYVVVNVETPGTLGETLTAAGKNPDAIKYIKVLGTVNADDFYYMRDNMAILQGVNMQETIVTENSIPENAFRDKNLLTSFFFPKEGLTSVGESAFVGTLLSGVLDLPEGIETINGFGGTRITSIIFPSSLVKIGAGCFENCKQLGGPLNFPENLSEIGTAAFKSCDMLDAEIVFPNSLVDLGHSVFEYSNKIRGDIILPKSLKKVPYGLFNGTSITSVLLHEGIIEIEGMAFCWCEKLKGEIHLPSTLLRIGDDAFAYSQISGSLILPDDLVYLGAGAFAQCPRLSGIVTIPEGVEIIEGGTFSGCSQLEGIVLPSSLSVISAHSFEDCFMIGSIVSYAPNPPRIDDAAFNGVAKDNFAVEVPENSVQNYSFAVGWNEFERITAHHNLSISRRLYKTLNPSESRTFVLRADSGAEWRIESKPDWVTVSPSSGIGKTDVTVTVNALATGSEARTGEVIFLLDGKDYRSTLTVEQYDYAYADGSVKVEQTHTLGSGIPLVFLGDCYDAEDIASGSYLADTEEAIGYFFDIEPYKSYQDYFDVYVVFGKSEDSGVGSVNTLREAKFGTQYSLTGGTLENNGTIAFQYARMVNPNLDITKSLVVVVLNSFDYGGLTYMWNDNSAIALCPKSMDPYPYDFRGLVQHEAGGHGFGKLADEYIYTNGFVTEDALRSLRADKSNGWSKNLSESGTRSLVPWSHLINHPSYSNTVDIYEGGYFFTRGIFRSEPNSCMNNNIPYYSAISRQAIVERIMDYAGLPFSLEDFYANDVTSVTTKASADASPAWQPVPSGSQNLKHHHPIIMGDHPNLK